MNHELLAYHQGTSTPRLEDVCQERVFTAVSLTQKQLSDALGTELHVFPTGSILNLKAIADIANVSLTPAIVKHLVHDIDLVMMTHSLSKKQERQFYKLVEKLDPIVSRYFRMNIQIELCYINNLQLHPTEYGNVEHYIPPYGDNETHENISLTLSSIRRVVEAIALAQLFGRGDFYLALLETLEKASQDLRFIERNTQFYRSLILREIHEDEAQPETNILTRVANKMYTPGFPPLKFKHVARALELKNGQPPTKAELAETVSNLRQQGYRVIEHSL